MTKRKQWKWEKCINKKYKKHLFVANCVLIGMLVIVISTTFYLGTKLVATKIMFNSVKKYNDAHYLYDITNETYCGIKLPKNVSISVYSDLKAADESIINYFFNNNRNTLGSYLLKSNKINILDTECNSDSRRILIHEIAHHTFYHNLTGWELMSIKNKYTQACDNYGEFYAYSVSDYGYFEGKWIERNGTSWTNQKE